MLRNFYHWFWAFFANILCGLPSRKLFVVGVTGTKGKSTTLEIMSAILEEAGETTALLTSATYKIGDDKKRNPYPNTMPGRGKIQHFLKEAASAGCSYAFVEVTSEGVVQHRHKFIGWDTAVFLNLHPEHIESHGSFEAYREAKLDFFRYARGHGAEDTLFLVNENDPNADYFKKAAGDGEGKEVVGFSEDDMHNLILELQKESNSPWLQAGFNHENISAAVVFAKRRGVEEKHIKKALLDFKGISGRMEFMQKEPVGVVIDYAHTPDSLEALYRALKDDLNYNRIVAVFGSAGGGRDKWKRPKLGEVAAKYCDKIILTSEDPYKEDPGQIIGDIKKGIPDEWFDLDIKGYDLHEPDYYEVVDRGEAIQRALNLARPGDVVAITGMGSQDYMYTNEGKIDWSDREAAERALERFGK